jgi:NADH dehydrogenase FAD-containing subunit
MTSRRKVVVIGAGFAGMPVVRALHDSHAEVTLKLWKLELFAVGN